MVFDGTLTSDFEKLIEVPDEQKQGLIEFASVDFLQLRNTLIDYIKAVYPTEFQDFAESDLGMVFIELVAYMGSVMSLKTDMLANEAYLKTSRNRNNVKKLLELIGVKMRGPIGASAQAQLTIEVTPTQSVTILAENRTFTVTAEEDGAPVDYTLYKIEEGKLATANPNSDITLQSFESANPNAVLPDSVYQNLSLIEGSFNRIVGSFTTADTIKKVVLPNFPVIEGSVEVFVISSDSSIGGVYKEVQNIYFAADDTDKIFQVNYTDDFGATVVFGDEFLGVSPNINSSYVITYRTGGGTRGNIGSEVINISIPVNIGTTLGTGRVENISLATGGQNSETVTHAKRYAPLTFRRQDRVVTLNDYSVFANTFIGSLGNVGKATAVARKAFSSANVIDVFLLEKVNNLQLQRATPAFKMELLEALNEKKMLTDEVVIVDGLIRTLDLVVTVNIDKALLVKEETIKLLARTQILSYFNVDNFEFGKPLILSDLTREIFKLKDIRFSSVDNLSENVRVDFNEIIQLNNLSLNVVAV